MTTIRIRIIKNGVAEDVIIDCDNKIIGNYSSLRKDRCTGCGKIGRRHKCTYSPSIMMKRMIGATKGDFK